MNDDETEAEVRADEVLELLNLRQAHQDLDAAVAALEATPQPDQLQIARLKKRKLSLRDRISELEDELTPDLIA